MLSEIQEQIWNNQKEEYELNYINTDQMIKKEIQQMYKILAEKEDIID